MPEPFTVKHVDDFESIEGSGGATWRLARRSLDLGAFGMNVVEVPAGGSLVEHDETGRDQVEVFVVLEGEATLLIDGAEHPAPAGTYGRIEPEPQRNVLNHGDAPVKVMIVSAPRTSGYEAMGWA